MWAPTYLELHIHTVMYTTTVTKAVSSTEVSQRFLACFIVLQQATEMILKSYWPYMKYSKLSALMNVSTIMLGAWERIPITP